MQEFLTYLVKNIVKNPDDVSTEEVLEGNTYVYTISVNQDDMGLVIGKEGRIIKSIRALAKSKAIKEGVMIRVELNEPDRVRPQREDAPVAEAAPVVEEAPVEETPVEEPIVEETPVEETPVEEDLA